MKIQVPVLPLHGIQFRRVGGDGWQYQMLAKAILRIPPLLTNHPSSSGSTATAARLAHGSPIFPSCFSPPSRHSSLVVPVFFYLTPPNTQHRPLLDFDRFITRSFQRKFHAVVNLSIVRQLPVYLFASSTTQIPRHIKTGQNLVSLCDLIDLLQSAIQHCKLRRTEVL